MSPVTKELTVNVLKTADCANRVETVTVFAVTVLNVPMRPVMLLTFRELTLSELKDPTEPVNELTKSELNDPT